MRCCMKILNLLKTVGWILSVVLVVVLMCNFFLAITNTIYKKDENASNRTLTEYIKNNNLKFYDENIICSALDKNEIIYYKDDLLVLDDYSIYVTNFGSDKIFSNEENCKKIEYDFEFTRDVTINGKMMFLDKENNLYTVDTENEVVEKADSTSKSLYNFFYRENKVVRHFGLDEERYYDVKTGSDYIINYHLVTKDDGKLYSVKVKMFTKGKNKNRYELLDEEVKLSDGYGIIQDIEFSNLEYSLDAKLKLYNFITTEDYYFYKPTNLEKCEKYEDIECEFSYVKSDLYDKYKKDILYLGKDYAILRDKNVIESDIFK